MLAGRARCTVHKGVIFHMVMCRACTVLPVCRGCGSNHFLQIVLAGGSSCVLGR